MNHFWRCISAIQIGHHEYWTHLTNRPPDSRYAELAESIVGNLPIEYQDNLIAQAFAVKLYLDEQTKYTMSERHETTPPIHRGVFLWSSCSVHWLLCTHIPCSRIFVASTWNPCKSWGGVCYASGATERVGYLSAG